jgi:hypothetical protein
MGSIFKNANTVKKRAASGRQKLYFDAKKTDRGRNNKPEEELQKELCKWIRSTLPGVHFRSDTGAGMFTSKFAKNTHNLQQSEKGLPDLTIYAARHGWHALMLELKPEGAELKMKRDGRTIRIYKDSKGKILERDYKIRLKGDWKSLHIERQNSRIEELKAERYCATFAIGIEQAKKIICWYFDIPYVENSQLEF